MALKYLLFVSLLIATIAAPVAKAQSGPGSGVIGLIRVQGILFCTMNGSAGVTGTATPVFPNALVQMQCGAGNAVASATTNGDGIFSILLDPLQFVLSSVLTDCKLVVNTPLSTCDVRLPSAGALQSPLQLVGNTLRGLLNITNLVPTGFQFITGLT